MRIHSLQGYRDRLFNLLEKAEKLDADQLELKSDLARYLCVLTSGYIEESVRAAILDHCDGRNQTQVMAFVTSEVGYFQNPKVGKIVELLRKFDGRWATEFERLMTDEQRDSINSVVGNRHRIAHGQSVSLSLVPMKTYLTQVVKSMENLRTVVK